MNSKMRTVEVDVATAQALEARAAELGTTVSELIADLVGANDVWPNDLEAMRRDGRGPWAPSALAEDARSYEAFERNGEGVPWDEVQAWVRSWGTPAELPKPRSRKL
jgi:hypothetical protein